jgi:hypothetical protein
MSTWAAPSFFYHSLPNIMRYFYLKYSSLFITLFALGSFSATSVYGRHPIHATVTTIEYNAKTKIFEMSCKFFADDLEEVIKRATGTQAFIGSGAKEVKNLNALLEQYLRKHVRLEADGKPLTSWTFVGKELEGEAVWCYMELPATPSVKRLLVENTVLMELYDDQTNLVNVQIPPTRRSALLRKNKQAETLEFP